VKERAVYIFDGIRTPFGKFLGQLSGYHAEELAALVFNKLLQKMNIGDGLDGVIVGNAMLGGAALTIARRAVLLSQLDNALPSIGVDRACCSGMSAIAAGAMEVLSENARLLIAGGTESLSSTPRLIPRNLGTVGSFEVDDPLLLRSPFSEGTIASYTSAEAVKLGVDREEQDNWALQSHQRFFQAEKSGFFDNERFPVAEKRAQGKQGEARALVITDEGPRQETSIESLRALKTVRGSTTITAGNAPGLSDGAAFVVMGDKNAGREHHLSPSAEIMGFVRVAGSPTSGTRIPALAIKKLLNKKNIRLTDVDYIEINEAFSAMPLVSTLELADGDIKRTAQLRDITNINGGSVAIGHPMGASGARLVMTLINQLKNKGGGLGVAAICGGYGQGEAILLKV
jgi:acetyl-CoA C-acetyltransferase